MLKALLRKQLQEFFSGFFVNGNNSKANKKGAKIGYILIFSVMLLSFSMMFFFMAFLFSPILDGASDWIYFAVFAVLSTLMGVFGSVFLTYNTLYEAKDNDLLLSMPIHPSKILFSRMAGLYITAFIFEMMAMLPACIVYFISAEIDVVSVFAIVLSVFLLPLPALSISCVLGWIIAIFASKFRNKGIITVIISVGFFAVYYTFAMKLNTIINTIIENAEDVGEWIRIYLYPLYKMSLGCTGDIASFLVFALIVLVLFGAVYKLISLNFIKLATSGKGMKKKEYKEKTAKVSSSRIAFLKKEFLFFKSTPAYMLNCALGSFLMILFAVFILFRGAGSFYAIYESFPLVFSLVICFIASTNNITSPSISLEAGNLWLLKSLPVNVKDIFYGKLMLHIIVTGIPLVIANLICGYALRGDIVSVLLSIIMGLSFVVLTAVIGLMLNLILPKLDWTNETVPIKQSLSSFLGMIAGLFCNIIIILLYFLLQMFVSPVVFLAVAILLINITNSILLHRLFTKGTERFLVL